MSKDEEAAQAVTKSMKNKIAIPREFIEILEGVVELDKTKQLIVSLKKDVVREVKELSPCKTLLLSGDILLYINKISVKEQIKKNFRDVADSLNRSAKANINFVRLKRRLTTNLVMPSSYPAQEGFDYEYAVLYNYNFFKLGLVLKPIGEKVYVSALDPGTIAAMAMSVGEAIIEIDGQVITNVDQVEMALLPKLGKSNMAKILVEIPATDPIRNMVRYELNKNKPVEDNPFPPGMFDFAEDGIKSAKQRVEPKKSIFKAKKAMDATQALSAVSAVSGLSGPRPAHININESTTENAVTPEVNTKLLVKCLPTKTAESEAALAQR